MDIIEFFDNMHKENIEELVNPVVVETTELNIEANDLMNQIQSGKL